MKETPYIIVIPQDVVFERVKAETSMRGIRSNDREGNSLFEALVLDEPNIGLFGSYLLGAQADVVSALSAYIVGKNYTDIFLDVVNSQHLADFKVTLAMPHGWNSNMYRPLVQAVLDYLAFAVLRSWYETKDADMAALYTTKALEQREAILRYANSRMPGMRRHTELY
jgi:hypothetical protein